MSRQVDVKALVSHIVKGDGLDKCRICMGDTSQGQVHLTDTVMMDGDKAVTLSELLEVITGVEVEYEEELPSTLCLTCSSSAFEAAKFQTLVQRAKRQWNNTVQLLDDIPNHGYAQTSDNILAIVSDNEINITDDCTKPVKLKTLNSVKKQKKHGKFKECQCPSCGKKFKYPLLLNKHLKESLDFLRACHICAIVISRNDMLKHVKEAHNIKLYNCKKCLALFPTPELYSEHKLKAHVPGTLKCTECGCSFKSLPALNAHKSVHSRRSCPNCDNVFLNQSCYTHHIKTCCKIQHIKGQPKTIVTLQNKENKTVKMGKRGSVNSKCICDICKKTFAAKKFVSAHIQIVHLKNTHRPCIYCGKLFAAAHMTTHLHSHSEPSFKCEYCGNILKSKLGFLQHVRLHTREQPYKCKLCGERFSSSSRRSEHMRNNHYKSKIVLKHCCSLCPAKFRLPCKLKLHVQKAHKEQSGILASYECVECHEKFASCRALVLHSKKHKQILA